MLRKIVLTFILADNFIFNLAKKPFGTKWALKGKCKKCGRCCQDVTLEINPKLLNNRFTTDLVVRWISWAFNFRLKEVDYDRCRLVFGCNNLNTDGTCKDYRWRPNICRNYPIMDYFERPSLFNTCGYKAIFRE